MSFLQFFFFKLKQAQNWENKVTFVIRVQNEKLQSAYVNVRFRRNCITYKTNVKPINFFFKVIFGKKVICRHLVLALTRIRKLPNNKPTNSVKLCVKFTKTKKKYGQTPLFSNKLIYQEVLRFKLGSWSVSYIYVFFLQIKKMRFQGIHNSQSKYRTPKGKFQHTFSIGFTMML